MKTVRTCVEGLRADLAAVNSRAGSPLLESVWTLDEAVPTGLSSRWSAANSDDILFRDFARTMINCGALVVLLGSIAGAAAGSGNPMILALSAAMAIAALVLGTFSHRRSRRHPGRFTAREIDLIIEHRREVVFDDWDSFVGTEVPREVHGARRADELARRVLTLPGWSSEHLAEHRIRLDPAQEATQIRLTARELYDLRRSLEPELEPDQDEARSVRALDAVRAEWGQQLDASWAALDERITAFDRYVQEVLDIVAQIEKSDLAKHLTTSLEEHAERLAVQTVRSEMATAHLQDLQSELIGIKSRMRGDGEVDL